MAIRKRKWKSVDGIELTAWIVDYYDQSGTRRLKTFEKKKNAEDFESSTRAEKRAGTHTPDSSSIKVGEAGDRWIEACESAGLERTSVDAYRSHLELHIKPFLGTRKLSQLTVPMITDFERRLRSGSDVQKPRSLAMVKRVRSDLGALLANAQEEGLVARNVVREVRASRRRGKERQAERRAKAKLRVGVDIPTPNEIRIIVGMLHGPLRPVLLTAIFAGLRASELRGLRWPNVDLVKREIHVRERADEYKQLGRPKSGAGERTVPVPPIVVNTLREWRLQCPSNELELVFPSPVHSGVVGLQYVVRRGLWPAQIAAGITKIGKDTNGKVTDVAKYQGLHALRHFFASWCINRKLDGGLELPAKVVQERLGHSTIAMTLDTYGHLFPRHDDSEELAAAERVLLG